MASWTKTIGPRLLLIALTVVKVAVCPVLYYARDRPYARRVPGNAGSIQSKADIVGSDMPAPFESQFFNDDATDMGDYADVDQALALDDAADDATVMGLGDELPSSTGAGPSGSGEAEDEDDLWAGTQGIQLKRARPENVNFAKRAKRIDVMRLKDDICGGLKDLVVGQVWHDHCTPA